MTALCECCGQALPAKCPVVVDLNRNIVTWSNGFARMTRREIDVISILAAEFGRAVSFEKLQSDTWSNNPTTDNNITVLVHKIRAKLTAGNAPVYVINHRGRGFELVLRAGAV